MGNGGSGRVLAVGVLLLCVSMCPPAALASTSLNWGAGLDSVAPAGAPTDAGLIGGLARERRR
jgi:hypothetical protein